MATKNTKVISIGSHVNHYDAATEKSENTIGQRIAEARKNAGMSQQSFADFLTSFGLDIQKAAESQWETGRTVPNAYQLVAICAALDIDDVRFFIKSNTPALNEEGQRRVAEYKADLIASGRYRPVSKAKSVIRYREMPVSSLVASAGTGAFLDDGNFDMVSFPENSIPDEAEFGIRVSGDSMEPVYHDGQIVWVEQCDNIGIGEVGIFILDGDGYIKSYDEQEPDDSIKENFIDAYGVMHNQPVLVSYNQAYRPRTVSPSSDFRLVGRVLN